MSAFMDPGESASTSAKAALLSSNCEGGSSSSCGSTQTAESDVNQTCTEFSQHTPSAGLESVSVGTSHEKDAGVLAPALGRRQDDAACGPSVDHCADEKEASTPGGTYEDPPLSKNEQPETKSEKEGPRSITSSDGFPAPTRNPQAGGESPTDADQSPGKKLQNLPRVGCTGGSRCGNVLSPKQTRSSLSPRMDCSASRMHPTLGDPEDKRRGETASALHPQANGKLLRSPRSRPEESHTTSEHHETPQKLATAHIAEKARGTADSAEGKANGPGRTFEKEGVCSKSLSQQSSTVNSVRRPVINKTSKRVPLQQSTSTRSLPGSRRASLLNTTDAEKKQSLSRGSTVDSQGTSTLSQGMGKRNFIKENMQNACVQQHHRQAKPPKGKPEPPRRHSSFGKIPEYLTQIKSQLQEEAKKALDKQAADKLPPGMRIMGDEERLETVRRLKKEQEEAEQELARMPIAIKTNAQRRRMEYLERRLGELDREQQKYSKPNILVGV